jgi:hypothetical protein
MKISPYLYLDLKTAIVAVVLDPQAIRQVYLSRGLSEVRLLWDCFHASRFDSNRLYNSGLNDTHIETALRSIGREIGLLS